MSIDLNKLDSIKKLTCEDMFEYIQKNDKDRLEEFSDKVCSWEYPKVAEPILNADGTPKMKTYNATKDGVKTGERKTKPAVKMVEDKTAEKRLVFNMLKAQRLFADWYKPELLEPKVKKEKKANGFMAIAKSMETK
jgi:hypothetical protein